MATPRKENPGPRHQQKLDAETVLVLRHLVWEKKMTYWKAAEKVGFKKGDITWRGLWKAIRGLTWRRIGGPMGGAYGRGYKSSTPYKKRMKEGRQ